MKTKSLISIRTDAQSLSSLQPNRPVSSPPSCQISPVNHRRLHARQSISPSFMDHARQSPLQSISVVRFLPGSRFFIFSEVSFLPLSVYFFEYIWDFIVSIYWVEYLWDLLVHYVSISWFASQSHWQRLFLFILYGVLKPFSFYPSGCLRFFCEG